MKNPNILAVAKSSRLIGEDLSVGGVIPEGKEEQADNYPSVRILHTDEDYLKVLNVSLVDGRYFSKDFNDSASFVINEEAARILGLTDPVGKRLNNLTEKLTGPIVGVVKDYHFTSLHNKIEPLIIQYKPNWTNHLWLKMRAGKTQETIKYVEETVKTLAPNSLFAYSFLDNRLDLLYKSEDNMGKVFQFFSVLAIIIACLGLLSLSAYTIESRTKEIGIRKVLGASVAGIVTLVSSKFFKLVMLGFIIAIPITLYSVDQWLQNFAYQIDIQWWVFAITGGFILFIAFAIVSFQTISAALSNPAKSLKYE